MEIFKSKGLVLKTIKYSESSIITHILTRELGVRSFIINGARKPKSSMPASLFQHGNFLHIVAYNKPYGQLARIHEVSPAHHYSQLPYKIETSSIAVFILEVIENTVRQEDIDPALFDFLEDKFIQLDGMQYGFGHFHLKFLVDYTKWLGIRPMENYSHEKPFFNMEAGRFTAAESERLGMDKVKSEMLFTLLSQESKIWGDISISKKLRMSLLRDLLIYYQIHIDGFKTIQSLDVLEQIF